MRGTSLIFTHNGGPKGWQGNHGPQTSDNYFVLWKCQRQFQCQSEFLSCSWLIIAVTISESTKAYKSKKDFTTKVGKDFRTNWPIPQVVHSANAKKRSALGDLPPWPLTRGSDPEPHWGLCTQTPVIGSRSPCALPPPNWSWMRQWARLLWRGWPPPRLV